MPTTPDSVLGFWFGPPASATETAERQRKLWFGKSPENDLAVAERFALTLTQAAEGKLAHWTTTPRGTLALVIVLDQFPHHVHRERREAFAYDDQALALSLAAIDAASDAGLAPIERVFLYLPLEHAESIALQERAVALFERLALEATPQERALFEDFADYARRHRDVVARFGRFPHRNALLGRTSSATELEFLRQPGSRF